MSYAGVDLFEKGAGTLREFCLLRAESIRGQLDGTIPSASEVCMTATISCFAPRLPLV